MQKTLTILLIGLMLAIPGMAQAPDLNISGAGARAMGMGGAFTAVADDATAVFYNPAGLCQLKRPELTLVGYMANKNNTGVQTSSDGSFLGFPYDISDSNYALNFGGFVLPLNPGGNNLIVAGSAHMIIDFQQNIKVPWTETLYEERNMSGGIYAYSGFLAYEVSKYLMVGSGVSYYQGSITDKDIRIEQNGPDMVMVTEPESTNDMKGEGVQVSFGALVKASPRLKLGATFKTESMLTWEEDFGGSMGITEIKLELPLVASAGSSYRVGDSLTLACDWQLYKWGDSRMTAGTMDIGTGTFFDSSQVHVGMEYLAPLLSGYPTPLRLGFYTYPLATPSQMEGYVADRSSMLSAPYTAKINTRNFFTGGFGVIMSRAVIDVAVEYSKLSETVGGDWTDDGLDDPLANDDTILKTYASMIVKF